MDPREVRNDKRRKVRRLVDVEVTHVSLVDRPANKTPFKLIKRDQSQEGESPMHISIKNMFGSRAPEVTSVIADTRPKAEAVAKMLMDGDKAEITEQDGLFVVRKAGTKPAEDERLIHMGKAAGVAYTVGNLQKELRLYDMEGENFTDMVQSEGFVPGLMVGMDALHATIRNIAMSEETNSADTFREKVANAMDEFAQYVDSLIGALPEKAFKFEKALAATGAQPIHFTPEGFNAEVYAAVFGDEAPTPSATMQENPAPETTTETTTETAPAEQVTADPATPPATPAQETASQGETPQEQPAAASADDPPKPDNLEELPRGTPEQTAPTAEEVIERTMDALTKKMGESLAAAMAPVNERLAAQDRAVERLTKAMGSTVATTPDEDGDNVVRLSKGEQKGESYGAEGPPLMDTAYNLKRG